MYRSNRIGPRTVPMRPSDDLDWWVRVRSCNGELVATVRARKMVGSS